MVYKLAKCKGGFVDPEMVDNQWKLYFYPKPKEENKEKTKEPAVQGESGGTAVKEEEEEEKKGEEALEEAPSDLAEESVKVQVQLLKIAGTDDQFVVEFKNKDFGS